MKNDTEINRILTSVTSWFLHTLSHQILVFQAPYDQILTRKSKKKELEKNIKKKHQCCSKVPEKLAKWGPEIDLKSIKIKLWIPGCPFCCPRLPQGAKVVPQGAKMEPPGLPNDSFGHQNDRPRSESHSFLKTMT